MITPARAGRVPALSGCRADGARVFAAVTEPELIRECRQGNRDAQRALYALTHERIYGLLLRMTRNAEDAADLMQETYLKVFDKMEQFREDSGLSTWVYRIATNEALQFLRRERYRREAPQKLQSPQRESVEQNHHSIEIEEALSVLPKTERELLVLKYFGELGYAEMADLLHLPVGTIASSLNRARRMLRNVLEGEGSPSPSRTDSGI